MGDDLVLFNIKDHVAFLALNRPENGNRINPELTQRLAEVCAEVDANPEIYLAVIIGAGNAFCAGGEAGAVDIREADEQTRLPASAAETMANIGCPTIAAINGEALGQGLELALACDIRIASSEAKFGLPQISAGQIPQDGGTQRLSRVVGRAKALEMILTGEIIDAPAALDIGLVNRVVSQDNLVSEVESIGSTLASKAPLALRYAKEAVTKGLDLTLEQGLRLEADLYFLLHTTADRVEGIKSFLEKRKPGYLGR